MTALLLTLHLLQAPAAPAPHGGASQPAAHLTLLPPLALRGWVPAQTPALASAAPPAWLPESPWGVRALEIGAGAAFLVGGQLAVGLANLLVFSMARSAGTAGALLFVVAVLLDVADALAFPLLAAWGTSTVADALGLKNTRFGGAALGAYLGAGATAVLLVASLLAISLSSSSLGSPSTTSDAMLFSLVAAGVALPVLCATGASLGLHWEAPLGSPASRTAPPAPGPALEPPRPLPEVDPRLAPPPAALGIRIPVLRWG